MPSNMRSSLSRRRRVAGSRHYPRTYQPLIMLVSSSVVLLRQRLKIAESVVAFDRVLMVDVHVRSKHPVRLLPHKAMLWIVALRVRSGIVRHVEKYVSLALDPPTFPVSVLFSQSLVAVAAEARRWVAAKVATFAVRDFRQWRKLAATALTFAGRYLFRFGSVLARGTALRRHNIQMVAGYEPAPASVFMTALGFNFAATAAFT